mmetsp:Transcript_11954/g.38292  ORF Transcript_11954/g.38292 Transcript_11954/m.38292 type:complete len:242 (+) Transcript_11954:1046-1771(+)
MRLGDRLGEAALARPARRLRGRGGGGGGVPRRRKARRRKDGRIQVSEARLRARACKRLGGVHRGSSARGEGVDGAQRAFLAAEAGEAAAQHEERVLAPDFAVVIGEDALGQVLADVVRAVPKGERLYDARPLARARLADAVGGRLADGDHVGAVHAEPAIRWQRVPVALCARQHLAHLVRRHDVHDVGGQTHLRHAMRTAEPFAQLGGVALARCSAGAVECLRPGCSHRRRRRAAATRLPC